jgi:glyoxylase-like metal-dependent hydrolase (beta-lactamase superfamily II)
MTIPFVRQFDFEYGTAARLSPLIERVIANNPGPFTFTGTGVYIIGDKNVAIIDPGPALPEHRAALDKALEGRCVSHVLLTHHHLDHSPLAAPLARDHGCKVYGRSVDTLYGADHDIKLDAGNDPSFKPDIELRCGDVIQGDGWTIEAIHTPGHTSNHMCFALREENTLFSGDHIMGWSTSVVIPPDGHMGDYLESLERIKARNFDCIWPTHGPCIDAVDNFISAYIDHRLDREAQIMAALESGLSEIMPIVEKLYTHVDKRLYPAAAHSVLSHLIHMRETGRVTSEDEDGLKASYRPAA